jgi:Ca-activated chloride channel family protein
MSNRRRKSRDRRGAMLIMVVVALVILLVGAVFSVDVAYMHMVRAELRTATDAAARAGSEALARTQDSALARAAAVDIAARNTVAGNGLSLAAGDVEVGSLRPVGGRFVFAPGATPFTAVRITGHRDAGTVDGAVPLFFARIFSANDFEPVQSATASANVRDVALVLDISGSMATSTGSGTRLDALQTAVNIFIDEVEASSPNTLLSLVTYSTSPTKVLALTDDFVAIRDEVDDFRADGLTAIGNALTMASDSLVSDPRNRGFAFKTIIVMTDGNHNTGPNPTTTVSTAVARGQTVHTITFSGGANQALMRSVANATNGGIHIHADGAADLAAAFRAIARTLSVTLVE